VRDCVEHATCRASEAREKAAASNDINAKMEWLKLAALWEELVREYGEFQKLRDRD